jgi:hypothetical protein
MTESRRKDFAMPKPEKGSKKEKIRIIPSKSTIPIMDFKLEKNLQE